MNKSRKSIVKGQRIDIGDDELLPANDKVEPRKSQNSLNPINSSDGEKQKIQYNNHDKMQAVNSLTSVTEKLVWTVSVSRPKFTMAPNNSENAMPFPVTKPPVKTQLLKSQPAHDTTKTSKYSTLTNPNTKKLSSGNPSSINALLSPRIGRRNLRSLTGSQEPSFPMPRRQHTVEDESGLVSVNEYSVISNLGWGSYGSVKLVENQEGKQYALKIISKRKLMKSAGFFRRQPPLRNSSANSHKASPVGQLSSVGNVEQHIPLNKLAHTNTTESKPPDSAHDRNSVNVQSKSITKQNPVFKSPTSQSRVSKLIDHQYTSLHADPLQRVYQEIAIHKKLDHPNIVKLREVIDEPDAPNLFMIFDLIEGGPVMIVGHTEPFSESIARKYFRDILLGLEYLHFNKIIHRDIKPSNLLLDENDKVIMIDFGISCQFTGDDIFLQDTIGSPAFLAPEVVQEYSTKFTGKALDIWSLGVTLYCFLYGRVPFESHNKFDLYRMIASKDVRFTEERTITAEAQDLLTTMLTKNPKERIKLSHIMTHSWVTENGKQPMSSLLNNKNNKNYINNNNDDISKISEINNDIKNTNLLIDTNDDVEDDINTNSNNNTPVPKQIEVTDLEISQCTVRRLKIQTIVTAYQIARRRSFRKNDPQIA